MCHARSAGITALASITASMLAMAARDSSSAASDAHASTCVSHRSRDSASWTRHIVISAVPAACASALRWAWTKMQCSMSAGHVTQRCAVTWPCTRMLWWAPQICRRYHQRYSWIQLHWLASPACPCPFRACNVATIMQHWVPLSSRHRPLPYLTFPCRVCPIILCTRVIMASSHPPQPTWMRWPLGHCHRHRR